MSTKNIMLFFFGNLEMPNKKQNEYKIKKTFNFINMSKNYISHNQCFVHDPKIRLEGYNKCAIKQKIKSVVAQIYNLLCSNTRADKSKLFDPSYDGSSQPDALLYLYLCQNVAMGRIG